MKTAGSFLARSNGTWRSSKRSRDTSTKRSNTGNRTKWFHPSPMTCNVASMNSGAVRLFRRLQALAPRPDIAGLFSCPGFVLIDRNETATGEGHAPHQGDQDFHPPRSRRQREVFDQDRHPVF